MDREINMQLANIVYIFSDPNEPGIKFYDRSPDYFVELLTGSLPEGKYRTDFFSISQAEWDSEMNVLNKSQIIRNIDGSYTATTIIVSPKKLAEIRKNIEEKKNEDYIIIDVRENKYTNNKDDLVYKLEQIKKELNNQFNDFPLDEDEYKENLNNIK